MTTDDGSQSPSKLDWIYGSNGEAELETRYDEWAESYDRDLVEGMGYRSPDMAVEALAAVVSPDVSVLDAGCGSGLVGVALKNRGFNDLTGVDLSAGMLDHARRTGAYRSLAHSSFGDYAEDGHRFDAIVSVGVFTPGHAPSEALLDLVRCGRPGGVVVIGFRSDAMESMGYRDQVEEMTAGGLWSVVAATEPTSALQDNGSHVLHEHWTFRIS